MRNPTAKIMSIEYELPRKAFWEMIEQYFEDHATQDAAEAEASLNIADLGQIHKMLQDTVLHCSGESDGECTVSVSQIEEYVREHSLDTATGVSWTEFQKMLSHLQPWKAAKAISEETILDPRSPTDSTDGNSMSAHTEVIQLKSKGFPPVHPEELRDVDSQEAAQHLLILVKDLDSEKMQRLNVFWMSAMDRYLEGHEKDGTDKSDNIARWKRERFYNTILEFLVDLCLEERKLLHYVREGTFMTLLPIHKETDSDKRKSIADSIGKVSESDLPVIDKRFWADWDEILDIVRLTSDEFTTRFREFVYNEYFPIICQETAKFVSATLAWTPLIPVDSRKATPEQQQKRKALIAMATKEDGERAAKAMKVDHAAFIASKSSTMQSALAKLPLYEDEMAVESYYKHLASVLKEKNEGVSAPATDTLHKVNAATTALDTLIAGGRLVKSSGEQSVTVCEYVSSADIVKIRDEQSIVNYQGALAWCDASAAGPRIGNMKKVVNCVLVDRTGPVLANVWGEGAQTICDAWNAIEAARADGVKSEGGNILDLQRVKITPLANNNWNGSSLTTTRTLGTVDVPKQPAMATKVSFLETPTESNMLHSEFTMLPASCCMTNFKAHESKFKAPFRITCTGTITDLKPVEFTQTGNPKESACFVTYKDICSFNTLHLFTSIPLPFLRTFLCPSPSPPPASHPSLPLGFLYNAFTVTSRLSCPALPTETKKKSSVSSTWWTNRDLGYPFVPCFTTANTLLWWKAERSSFTTQLVDVKLALHQAWYICTRMLSCFQFQYR